MKREFDRRGSALRPKRSPELFYLSKSHKHQITIIAGDLSQRLSKISGSRSRCRRLKSGAFSMPCRSAVPVTFILCSLSGALVNSLLRSQMHPDLSGFVIHENDFPPLLEPFVF